MIGICMSCGYAVEDNFDCCPHCGSGAILIQEDDDEWEEDYDEDEEYDGIDMAGDW